MLFTHATASRIKTYKDCEFRYFLEYHLQLPSMRDGNIYSEKGSAVHLSLEHYMNALIGATEDAELDYEKTLVDYYATSELWKLDSRGSSKGGYPHPCQKVCEACEWATKDSNCLIAKKQIALVEGCPRQNFSEDLQLIKHTLTRNDYNPFELDSDGKLKKKVLGVEKFFEMELGGVPVRGYMDLVVEEDSNTIEVVDYKTGKSMSYEKASNDPQVRIYGAVARILYPQYKYVIVTLHYLKSKPVSIFLSQEDDELTVESLQRAYSQISSNNNPTRKKIWLCPYCVGYDECGKIFDKFKKGRGRFKLPVLSCSYSDEDGKCYGNLHPIKQTVEIDTVDEIIYSCAGHSLIPEGGKYKERAHDGPQIV